jgi:hypothetical protein
VNPLGAERLADYVLPAREQLRQTASERILEGRFAFEEPRA